MGRAATKGSGQRRLGKKREIEGIKEELCKQQTQTRQGRKWGRTNFSGKTINRLGGSNVYTTGRRGKRTESAMEKGSK